MTNEQIKQYLNNRPQNYARNNYDAFLEEVGFIFTIPSVHITGTNGKGSVAHYIAACLNEAGYKVGLYTSPHFIEPTELITINGVQITLDEIGVFIKKYQLLFDKHSLSFFEIMTYISFKYFINTKIDFAVIEVGMGGLIDATNVFTPNLSIITNVKTDHVSYLGKDLIDIAVHKSGIMKKNIPLLLGNIAGSELQVILKRARELDCKVIHAGLPQNIEITSPKLLAFTYLHNVYELAIGAIFEAQNAAVAISALNILTKQGFNIPHASIIKGLKETVIPGRFTVIQTKPLIIIDGAHNPHAMMNLLNSIKAFTNNSIKVVFAGFKDKDIKQQLNLFALSNCKVTLTTFVHERANNNYEDYSYQFIIDHQQAIKQELTNLAENEILLITGSLYFAYLVISEFTGGLYK